MQPAGQIRQRLADATPAARSPNRRPVGGTKLAPASVRSWTNDTALLAGLLAATSKGDRRAFARLYELTSARLLAVALRILRRRSVAEEVLQESFLAVWQRAGQRRLDNSSPMAWMVTIVRNRAIDRLRAARNEAQDTFEEAEEIIAAPGLDPDYAFEADAMGDFIWTAIGKLPMNHRNAILAAFYYGLTHEELAEKFNVPLGTAKSWVRRGLVQLKHDLENDRFSGVEDWG